MDPILQQLALDAGIHFIGATGFQPTDLRQLAMDAQTATITTSNAGIPAFLSTLVDPKAIEILVAPMRAAEIVGEEVKKGDWLTDVAAFPVIESTGETSSYGDYSNNGSTGANINWTNRQSYHYQTITQYGERELERAGLAKIDWANRLSIASILVLNKFQNKSYFFGVAGLQNYGLLNDPNLYAPITPIPVPAGQPNAGAITWALKDANAIYADIAALYAQLQAQSNGLIDLNTRMTLAMSPGAQAQMTKTNNFAVNVADFTKKNFPNMRFETAPEYATPAGQLIQLYADELEGQRTAQVAFTEKLRQHPVVVGLSNFSQKKSQGTWGAIIYRPFLVAQMIGV